MRGHKNESMGTQDVRRTGGGHVAAVRAVRPAVEHGDRAVPADSVHSGAFVTGGALT